MNTLSISPPHNKQGEPVWGLMELFPKQGDWSESEYLSLNTNHLVEFSNGYLDILPMPTLHHQYIVVYLLKVLSTFVEKWELGDVLIAPLPVYLWPGKYREPDVIFLSTQRLEHLQGNYPLGADLVMEVTSDSPEDRDRDLIAKRKEYAQAGIAEYWIIDPQYKQVTVLQLVENEYVVHGEFVAGQQATSVLLNGFEVDVTPLFAMGNWKK